MQIITKKRSLIKIISFISAVIIVLGIFLFLKASESARYERLLSSAYQRSFADLSETLDNLNYTLMKGAYVQSPYQTVALAAQVWRDTGTAKSALEQLPVSELNLNETSKFLSQSGDYAFTLAKKVMNSEEITDEEKENMKKLADYAKTLSGEIIMLEERILEDNAGYSQLIKMFESSGSDEEPASEASAQPENSDNPLEKIKSEIEGLPTLIYDGPFSDHLFDAESVFLKNTDAVTVEEAKKKASYILDLKSDRLEYQGDINSRKNKSFYFSYKDYDIFITAMGGYCQSFSKQRDIGDIKISDEDAVKKAKDFLTKISYKNMKETYYSESGNILTVNFAYMQGDVMCYPDLIKVGVALDNGEIVSLDASSYLQSHLNTREFKQSVNKNDAEKLISKNLTILSHQMCIVPSEGNYERFCHEFKVRSENGEYALIYINAENGREENVLILIQNENGTLVM